MELLFTALTVVKQVYATEFFDEGLDGRSLPRRDNGAVRQLRRRRIRVKLARKVAILAEAAITVIRPETVKRPAAFGQ